MAGSVNEPCSERRAARQFRARLKPGGGPEAPYEGFGLNVCETCALAPDQNLNHSVLGGAPEGVDCAAERHLIRNHRFDIDGTPSEQFQGWFESSAPRSDKRNFIYDDRCGIDRHFAVHRGFQDYGAARLNHSNGGAQAGRGAGGIDYPFIFRNGKVRAGDFGGDALRGRDAELLAVAAELMHAASVRLQHLRNQQPQLAVAQHRNRATFRNGNLIEDFAGCGNGFGENGRFRSQRIGYETQISFRQNEEFAERARLPHDAKYGAAGAMALEAPRAPGAGMAREVDFSDHPPARERMRVRLNHFAYEFMTGRAGEAVVAAPELKVGIADAAREEPDQRKALGALRPRDVAKIHAAVFNVNGNQAGWAAARAAAMARMRPRVPSMRWRAFGMLSASFSRLTQ